MHANMIGYKVNNPFESFLPRRAVPPPGLGPINVVYEAGGLLRDRTWRPAPYSLRAKPSRAPRGLSKLQAHPQISTSNETQRVML